MRRPCSICIRPDAEDLLQARKNGASSLSIAKRHGLHPRLLQQHFAKHTNGRLAKSIGGRKGVAALDAIRVKIDTHAEAHATHQRIARLLDDAITTVGSGHLDKDSHGVVQGYLKELRGSLEMLARLNGELQTSGTTIVNQIGVRIEQAKEAVEIVSEANDMSEGEQARACASFLRTYNALHPEDAQWPALAIEEGDDPQPPG